MVIYPGFSERIFEFAFNAEFALKHYAVLAASPGLPSLQQEKKLGYDVEFQLKARGGGIQNIFLQHKVARLVNSKSGSNRHFFDAAKGPYFAFNLDVPQYNLIRDLAMHRKRRIYYCAPLSASRRDLDQYFMTRKICASSLWMDVRSAGRINDKKAHSIVYSQDGKRASRFSPEPNAVTTMQPAPFIDAPDRCERGFDRDEARQLYEDVHGELLEHWDELARPAVDTSGRSDSDERWALTRVIPVGGPPERLSRTANRGKFLAAISQLLTTWYGVSWLIVCNHEQKDMPRSPMSAVAE